MPTYNGEEALIPVQSSYWNCVRFERYEKYHRFNQDQFYEGEFFRDSIHGQGVYKWKDSGVYEGGFYSNSKEGYASLSFPDNSYFEGLFIKNQPFGPGILTYANGRQDAGFWMGRKLIRLSRAVDYIIPRLAPTSAAKIKLLQFKRFLPLNEEFYDSTTDIMEKFGYPPINFLTPFSKVIYDPRSIFFDKHIFDVTYFLNVQDLSEEFIKDTKDLENGIRQSVELLEEEEDSSSFEENRVPSHCLCRQDEFVMSYGNADETDVCERQSVKGEVEMGILAYFTKLKMSEELEESEEVEETKIFQQSGEEKDESKCPKILLWNRSELCKEILKQMFRYRGFEEKLNFNLAKLMLGARTAFRKTGEKEKQCLQLLKMCSLGPAHAVKDLLCSYEISHSLMDGRGNNSLMFAAATDQHEIMDILLDYGVDANNFNDEGLTPLNLCLLRRLALTNKISNWETAFLPQEVDKSLFPDDIQEEEFQAFQSISSLDRIFGDGMSANDSKAFINNQYLSLLPTPLKDSSQSMSIKTQDFYDAFEGFNLSRITILDLLRSPKTYSVMTIEEDGNKNYVENLNSFCSFQSIHSSQRIDSKEPTPSINIKMVPKTIKKEEFERSLQKVSTDRYLFEFTFKKNPIVAGSKKEKEGTAKSSKAKSSRAQEKEKEEKKEEETDAEQQELELNKKLVEIDKTIEKLLRRGADPNISEVPKPSIHLGVHTKDLNTVLTLLSFGASPDNQLYENEGLLTPLHVIVLKEPEQINVQICELLLQFGANPELETAPEFSMSEEEKILLNSDCGRTPLQLLCMRPDLEYGDPCDNLLGIGYLLANASNKRHFYNGHSCLTLAMLCGNFKILKALLGCFDPNDILGNDRGTALHVLVSTELQKITPYDSSIKMCDLLISKGADPLKKFKNPVKLFGTCVDYGYREIEAEKEARKANAPGKKDGSRGGKSGKEKTVGRDHLKDHERVVEYLAKIASNMAKNKDADNVKSTGKAKNRDLEEINERGSKDTKRKNRSRGRDSELTESQERKEILSVAKSETKKDYSEVEKMKKDFSGRLETPEVKETELRVNNDGGIWEEREDLKKEKKKKQRDVEKDFCKVKSPEKKDSEKFKGRHKIGTDSNDRIKKDFLRESRRSHNLEKFPEKIRQTIFQMYGNRFDIDINELLVPYVVLRNGELYYRFHKKSACEKEQYSLI